MMFEQTRRSMLKRLGIAGVVGTVGGAGAGVAGGDGPAYDQGLEPVGHSLLSDPVGSFADSDIDPSGEFAVVGGYQGTGELPAGVDVGVRERTDGVRQ